VGPIYDHPVIDEVEARPAEPARRKRHPLRKRATEFGALQKGRELSEFLWLVEEHRPRNVLEIGTCAGGTLYCLCRLAEPDGTIVSIDLPGGDFGGGCTEERVEEMRMLFPRGDQRLHLLREDSHSSATLAKVQTILAERQLDLLFIDGDHTYEGVRSDFEKYSPLARDGALIAFHDIVEHAPEARVGVGRYWNEIKAGYRHVEIVSPPSGWGGIGVLWKSANQ
jgi:predicted O-methyltransferase YrrM